MVTLAEQKLQAQKDAAAKQRARDKFLATGGTETQIRIFELEKILKGLNFQRPLNTFQQSRFDNTQNEIARLKGQPVVNQVSPDIEKKIIDRVASLLERERKAIAGTSTEISRIVIVGTGGEQIGTS